MAGNKGPVNLSALPGMWPPLPKSALPGILWPALPAPQDAAALSYLHQVEESQWWSPDRLLAAQLRQLEPLLAHAARTVPFYKERLRPLSGTPPGGLTMEAFTGLPLLTRSEIQEAGEALVSRAMPRGHGKVSDVFTSGSTGRPITVKTTFVTTVVFQALNQRYHLWHRRNTMGRLALIRTLRDQYLKSSQTGIPARWVPGFVTGPGHVFDITKPVRQQLAWLVGQKADYLLTYPTNLAALVRESEESGVKPEGLCGVMTLSEVLEDEVRESCKRVWGVEISDVYSAQELGMIAIQCPDHPHYHVQSESVLVEVLKDDDTAAGPGERGRVVISCLNNFASPLIRYEIGDYAQVGGPCSCGRGLPVLTRILGRSRNMVTLANGDRFYPGYGGLKLSEFPEIRQFQMIQHSTEEIEVKIAAGQPLAPEVETLFVGRIRKSLRHPFQIRFTYVDKIHLSASGKFEDFLSLV